MMINEVLQEKLKLEFISQYFALNKKRPELTLVFF